MNAQLCSFETESGHPSVIDPIAMELPYAWVEAPLDARLTWARKISQDWRNTDHWPTGRLFGKHAEYRWQVDACGKLRCVLLTEVSVPKNLPAGKPVVTLEALDCANLLLWGDWIDPQKDPDNNPDEEMRFCAPEIPSVLDYPLARQTVGNQVPCLIIRRYHHHELGEFVRCVGVELQTLRKEP